ncbi:DUF835 domain-containing protein [Pyrococcus sp. ST04]|uniref:DUF835 domain-containing protein n=1 Tax=Pyrococcus sp. ST04 TaxID=1183377 RepID=UPI0002605FB4|nr:DUF835 domain-containing protein [Pyrococcus sp. ST04]AFK23340.1 hypothetical protein Py04_1772 [Pyrococcus sp. ST04]
MPTFEGIVSALEIILIFGMILVVGISAYFRSRFVSKFPELKMSYDLILSAFFIFLITDIIFGYTGYRVYLYQVEKGTVGRVILVAQTLYLTSTVLFLLGWFSILRATLGLSLPWKREKMLDIKPGVYIVFDKDAIGEFKKLDMRRLALTRDPWKLADEENVYWITKTQEDKVERRISPTNMEYMTQLMVNFMKATKDAKAILIDGLEYLIVENGFVPVFKMLTKIHDFAKRYDAIIFVPITRDVLEKRELALLKKEFEEK